MHKVVKILLTGQPGSGKSRLLAQVLSQVKPHTGFITNEVRSDRVRVGLQMVDSHGAKAMLASLDSPSRIRVGGMGVNVEAIDFMVDRVRRFRPGDLLHIDEIGMMQLYSSNFQELVKTFLQSKHNDFIGTLTSVYRHEFVTRLRHDRKIMHFNVTEANFDRQLRLILRLLREGT